MNLFRLIWPRRGTPPARVEDAESHELRAELAVTVQRFERRASAVDTIARGALDFMQQGGGR